jgi:hypothetical protein
MDVELSAPVRLSGGQSKKGMKRPPNAGRKPGHPNHATADIKALAFKHCPEAIAELQRLMKDPNPTTRLAAQFTA